MLPNQLANNTIADANQVMENFNYLEALFSAFIPTGLMLPFPARTLPSSTYFLECDGTAISRSTYDDLFNVLVPNLGAFTVTIASPGVFTLTGHGLLTGDQVYLTTTGALPTGLSQNTIYWVTKIDANTFKLATSLANAKASTNINTSGTQSGVHSLFYCPFGLGDGSTTFNLPNGKGKTMFGRDTADVNFDLLNVPNTYVGAKQQTVSGTTGTASGDSNFFNLGDENFAGNGSGHAHSFSKTIDILPPHFIGRWIIKT